MPPDCPGPYTHSHGATVLTKPNYFGHVIWSAMYFLGATSKYPCSQQQWIQKYLFSTHLGLKKKKNKDLTTL